MKYRSEIDGLRAIAILPVILFHAGFETFSGGFVGVDVFFVISGYLITTLIINEKDEGKFSLLNFYERRARRILPALYFVVLCSVPFAWFLLLPSDMKDFSQSLVAAATFSSNILFWQESGYFDTATELKPLLHTWSLAVEEQFYILFPLFLIAAWRFGKRAIIWSLVSVAAISFAMAQWGAHNYPAATFYLLPTRAWELLIGSFAAFYLQKRSAISPLWVSNSLSAVGLIGILYGVFAFDEATPFPSVYALAPTIGTVLIIIFAVRGTAIHALLSVKAFVGLGLISYSLYLWHQPLFAFWRYQKFPVVTDFEYIVLIAIAFMLSIFSYFTIERIRRANIRRLAVLWFAAISSSIISAIGLAGHFADGFAFRLKGENLIFSDMQFYREEYWGDYSRFVNSKDEMVVGFSAAEGVNVLVIGNSWAFDLAYALAELPDIQVAYQNFTGHRCSEYILPNVDREDNEFSIWLERCGRNRDRFSSIPRNTDIVLLADNIFESEQYADQHVYSAFLKNLEMIRSDFSGQIVVVKGRPTWVFGGGYRIASVVEEITTETNQFLQHILAETVQELEKAHQYYEDFYRKYNVTYITLVDPLCPVNADLQKRVCMVLGEGEVFYFDGSHLTAEGGEVVVDYVRSQFFDH